MGTLKQHADVELYDQHQEDSPHRPPVLDENLFEGADAKQDIPPLGQDLDGDVDQQDSRVYPQRGEYEEPTPRIAGFQPKTEQDQKDQHHEPGVQGSMDKAHYG